MTTTTDGLAITRHAQTRLQQRGFQFDELEMIIRYGQPYYAGANPTPTKAYWFTHRCLQLVNTPEQHEHLANAAVVMTDDGEIVTVYHVRKRPRHWKPARH